MRGVTLLGSTGSIGTSALAVIANQPQRFRVVALTAHANVEALIGQCRQFRPEYAVLGDALHAEHAQRRLRESGVETQILCGADALERVATLPQVDSVVAGIVGAAGLRSCLAAVHSGKRVLLANKEALVMAGELFMSAVQRHGATLLPIDSEHNAIHQALPSGFRGDLDEAGVRRILLTASGGPFRLFSEQALEQVSVEQACAHPNWVMGRKISVDSATMMNKGLEVIEARWLFNAPRERIGVLIHPQSIVHSMVEYVDGSIVAQLGQPDMRTPIAYALAHPDRIASGVQPLDLARIGTLEFAAPDHGRFPCLKLAYAALEQGGTLPAVLNAANEVAVGAFLERRIRFTAIARLIEHVLAEAVREPASTLAEVFAADAAAREQANAWIARTGAKPLPAAESAYARGAS